MKRLIPWLAPCLILGSVLLYLLIPRFSLDVNQICEMLSTGNTRGIQMFYHSAGALGPLVSIGIGLLSFLVPVLKPTYFHEANLEFFSPLQGSLLTFLSGGLALTILVLGAISLWSVLPRLIRDRLKSVPHLKSILLLFCMALLAIRSI